MRSQRSKYRFASFQKHRPAEYWTDVPVGSGMHDSNWASANSKFIAVVLKAPAGGRVGVFKNDSPCRVTSTTPSINGHTRPVLDLAFSPFNEHHLVTVSDDSTICVWEIPEEGITENMSTPAAVFDGHDRKVSMVRFHPSVDGLFLTGSFDRTVRLWDISEGREVACFELPAIPIGAEWNWDGSKIAVTGRDKQLYILDSHTGEILSKTDTQCPGAKPPRVIWLGTSGHVACSGFNHASERVLSVFDEKMEQVFEWEGSQSSSTLMPFWDENSKLVILVGKGTQELITFEQMVHPEKGLHYTFSFRLSLPKPCVGAAIRPVHCLDSMRTEVLYFFCATKKEIYPISIKVPQRSSGFNKKFYSKYTVAEPVLTVAEFEAGSNAAPICREFTPAGTPVATPMARKQATFAPKAAEPKKDEAEDLKAQLAALQAKLAAAESKPEPKPEPVKEEPKPEPVKEEPKPEPVVVEEPVAEEPKPEPVPEPVEEPKVVEPVPEPEAKAAPPPPPKKSKPAPPPKPAKESPLVKENEELKVRVTELEAEVAKLRSELDEAARWKPKGSLHDTIVASGIAGEGDEVDDDSFSD